MKKFAKSLFLFPILVLMAACTGVAELERNETFDITITACSESRTSGTKTLLQSSGAVYWNPGDAMSLFFNEGTEGGSRFVSECTQVESVSTFKGSITNVSGGGEDFVGNGTFWGVYPYSQENMCDGESVTLPVRKVQDGLEESFAIGFFPTVACSSGLELAFFNVCGGVKFSVWNEGIKSVKFKANGGEMLAGKVRVNFDENNRPSVMEVQEGSDEVVLNAPNEGTFEVGIHYYIVALPAELKEGYTMTFYKTDQTEAEVVQSTPVTIKRSVFGVVDNADKNITDWKRSEDSGNPDLEGDLESGLYIGIIGFNQNLYELPIRRLTYNGQSSFYEFIDGLTTLNGTLLYYAADNAISALVDSSYPEDLYSVAMVTFTDGLDQGSLMMNWDYETEDDYLTAINSRFYSEKVSGLPITAYSIGVRGDDVADIKSFQNNLSKLSSSAENVAEVTSMSEIEAKFEEIADELSKTINEQTVSMNVPGKATGTKFRFTLDDVSNALDSKMYIEGVMDRRAGTLSELVYVGLTSTSGEVVTGIQNGIFFNFTFEGIRTDDGEFISENNIRQWTFETSSSIWQINSEFDQAEDSEVVTEKKSAAIILVLDCSKSLGDDIGLVKSAAKSFIDKLYRASSDPLAVAAVSLNKSCLNMNVGQSEGLNVTVVPETAVDKSVVWTSNNADVATVDVNGVVSARSSGNAMIYVTSPSGSKTATCRVSVVQKAQSISLSSESLDMYVGKTYHLTAEVLPGGTTNSTVQWRSSDISVATVDQEGKVTALKPGKIMISANTMDGTALKAVCFLTVREDVMAEFPGREMLSVQETSYDGFKMQVRIPSSVKESVGGVAGGRAIRYNFGNLLMYNRNRSKGYDDYYTLLYNGSNFLREETVLEFSAENIMGEVGYDVNEDGVVDKNDLGYQWTPIVPGEPIVFIAGEFEWMEEPDDLPSGVVYEVNGFPYPSYWEPGYYLPCLDPDKYFADKTSKTLVEDIDLSVGMDSYWTGVFQRKVFRVKEPDVLDAEVDISVKWTTSTDAEVEVTVPDGVYGYCYGFLSDAEYARYVELLGDESYMQWFATSYYACYSDGFEKSKSNATIRLSEVLSQVIPGTRYHILVTALGNEEGTTQRFIHKTFDTVPSGDFPVPNIEIIPIPHLSSPDNAVFNIRNINRSAPVTKATYAANYVREWEKVNNDASFAGETEFLPRELEQINTDAGLNIEVPGVDGETMRIGVLYYGEYGLVNATPVFADCEIPWHSEVPVSSSLLTTDALVGDWNVNAVLNDGTQLSSTMTIVRRIDYDEVMPEDALKVYREVTDLSDTEIYAYYDQFKENTEIFNTKRLAGQNQLLMVGKLNRYSNVDIPVSWPCDLFVSRDYNAVDVQQLFFDFGPKYFLKVKQDGSVVMMAEERNGLPVTGYTQPAYMSACNEHGVLSSECEFEVSVSEDNMRLTIRPYEDASGVLWYPNAIDNMGWLQNQILSEIILTKLSSQ